MYSSICEQLDHGRTVFLVLLDLSAAYDTISHQLLIDLLVSKFNIGGTVLSWIRSYLSDCSYQVKIDSDLSVSLALSFFIVLWHPFQSF